MFLQLQGENKAVVDALRRGDLDSAPLCEPDRQLLELARLLTISPHHCSRDHIDRVRRAGWTDSQIAEAVYITAMFAFFNRVADAFGIADPQFR